MIEGRLKHLQFGLMAAKKSFSFKRWANFFLNYYEYRKGKSVLRSSPRQATIETVNYCNLRCPACPTLTPLMHGKKRAMQAKDFKRIIDQIGDYLMFVAVNPSGEAFLNKDIWRIIQILNQKRIFIYLESNFNLLSPKVVRKIIDSNLDYLSVSIDGVNAETYQQYRIGGNFFQVINNLKKLVSFKRKFKRTKPYIRWQFISMKHNEQEREKARGLAKKIGVDEFSTWLPFAPLAEYYIFQENEKIVKSIDKKFSPQNKRFKITGPKDLLSCYQAFQELVVNVDGSVIPCCRLREKEIIFGNVFTEKFDDIWNNHYFQFFRSNIGKMGENKNCRVCYQMIKKYLQNYPRQTKRK